MVKLFKNKVDFTGVAVLLMAFFVAVGFKAAESVQAAQWYQVNDTGTTPGNPEDQEIGNAIDAPVDPCLESEGIICAIQLTLSGGASVPETVAEADTASGVMVGPSRFRPED